jgi:hypothetical protein
MLIWSSETLVATSKVIPFFSSILCQCIRPDHYGRRLLPRVPNALGEGTKTLGEAFPITTLGEELPGMPLTGKRSSPSVKNRTLGEAFPECRPNTRGRFDTVGAVRRLFLTSSPSASATLGEEIPFFIPLPRVQHLGKIFVFLENLFPECPRCDTGEEFSFFLKILFPECRRPNTRGRISFF